MENYKIRVESEEESKEVQELFFELGFDKKSISGRYPNWISNFEYLNGRVERYTSQPSDSWLLKCKEITLPELRDLVVLKRNDVEDATHKDKLNELWFVSSSDTGYSWDYGNEKWDMENSDIKSAHRLKPIEKTMKEYLVESNDGLYIYLNDITCIPTDSVIEIPEGANYVSKKDCKFYFSSKNDFDRFDHGSIVWQREPKLPFNTDLEDSVNHPTHYSSGEIECIDAIQSSMTHEAFFGYLKGNVQKYMWRYENKGGTESLKKAQWYLNKLIEVRNETSSED